MIIGGKNTPTIGGGKKIDENSNLKLVETKTIGPGTLLHYRI